MKKVLKSRLTAGVLVLVVVCLGIVFAGDVIVKEGDLVVGGCLTTTSTGIFGGHLIPDTDNAYDLGLGVAPPDEKHWRNLNLKGDITGANIDVTGDISGDTLIAESELKIKDGATPFYRSIKNPAGNMFANRTFTLSLGDADRTLTMTGNPTLADWFNQSVKTTSSPTFNTVTAKLISTDIKLDLDGNGGTGTFKLGAGQDAGIWYDGTHLHIDPALVGSGTVIIDNLPTSDPQVAGGLFVDANRFLKVSSGPPPPP